MKKTNKLFAILFALLGVQSLAAQETFISGGDNLNYQYNFGSPSNHAIPEIWTSDARQGFNFSQTVTLPNGVYTLSFQMMYRASEDAGTSTNCALYAETSGELYSEPIKNLGDVSGHGNSLSGVTSLMNADENNYKNTIPYFIVTDGRATVGARSLGALTYYYNGYWTIYNPSSFKLTSVVDETTLSTALEAVKTEAKNILDAAVASDAKTTLQSAYDAAIATSESIVALKKAIKAYLPSTGTSDNPVDVSSLILSADFGQKAFIVATKNNNSGVSAAELQPVGWTCTDTGSGQYNFFDVVSNDATYDGQSGFAYNGKTTGQTLYLRHAWGSAAVLTAKQTVNLPNGRYKISIPARKTANTATVKYTFAGETDTHELTTSWTVYEKIFTVNDENNELTIELTYSHPADAGANRAFFDGVTLLCYGDPIAALLKEIGDKLPTLKSYEGTIPTSLYASFEANLTAAESANNTQSESELQTILDNLNTNIAAADVAVAPYASLGDFISLCTEYADTQNSNANTETILSDFQAAIATATTAKEAATSVDELTAAYNTLETARQIYAQNAVPVSPYSFDMTFLMTNPQVTSATGWTNGTTATGQQYTGAPDNTYLDFYQVTRDMYQTLGNLPVGTYAVKAATRGHADVPVGYIYVKNGNDKITADIHKVGSSGNDLGNGWGWTTTNAVAVMDGQLTIGFYSECGTYQWVGADNFTLTRTFVINDVQQSITSLKAEAESLVGKKMNSNVASVLSETIDKTDATKTDVLELTNMATSLVNTIADAKTSIADYEKLLKYINMTKVFTEVSSYETKYANSEYASADVETVRRELNLMRFEAASEVFTNNIDVTGWTGTMGDKTTSGQHWDGVTGDNATKYYDNNSWKGSAHSTATTVTLPAGTYVLKAALRSNPNTTLKLTVLDQVVDVDGKGDKGYGIDVTGKANFSAEGTYANTNAENDDNLGRGWEWEFVQFELTEETEVTLTVECNYNGVYGWASFSDITLWMDDATYVTVYGSAIDAPLAEANALVNTLPMGETENAALVAAIAACNTKATTPAELNAQVDGLTTAVANANAWVASYNTAKADLVTALERFEADYNDAENGALDHMAKSRWATVITEAGDAAVAKDNQIDHTVLTDATTELVAALDAAKTSISEYAELKKAIDEANALVGGANWGDGPFQRPESAKEALATADAQTLYDAATQDGESVTDITAALTAAQEITLNVPDDDNVFNLNVATEDHSLIGNSVVASLGTTGDNNKTGYGFNASVVTSNYGPKAFSFSQVEGNLYNISVWVNGEKVYLTYGALNESAAGHKNWQIQGNTNIDNAGAFKIEASSTIENGIRIMNTLTNTYVDCQDGGSIYTDDNKLLHDFVLVDASTVTTSINIAAGVQLATCVLLFDAQLPVGLKAYTTESLEGDCLNLAEATELKAYTPYILYAEEGYQGELTGTVDLTDYALKVTDANGLLAGAVETQTITEGYVLQNQEETGVAFYVVDTDNGQELTIPAGKCWLDVAKESTPEATTRSIIVRFPGDETTGIEGFEIPVLIENGEIYTIDGKRVETMQSGQIYIVGGKKVIKK